MLAIGIEDGLPNFRVDLRRLEDATDLAFAATTKSYPSLDVPFHSRWRHFVVNGQVNGEDRWAWLSVLRAPWCGLSLADLHKLTSDDDDAIKRSPVPELMRQRTNLLSAEGQRAVKRVLWAIEDAPQMEPAALGTRIEQLWLRLGGAGCVNDEAQANLDLLWSCLDALPDGEPDLLGSALESALKKLTALPDPHAESDCGVQLMTIHKSKGLEFEVVIVPDLQGKPAMTHQKMLSWMERGIT